MKNYVTPSLNVVSLDVSDVITMSAPVDPTREDIMWIE